MSPTAYWLHPYAFVCNTVDHAVVLNLRTDRYLAIPLELSPSLARQVTGWPDTGEAPTVDSTSPLYLEAIETLLKQGVISPTSTSVTQPHPTMPLPDLALLATALLHTLDDAKPPPPTVTLLDLLRFMRAFLHVSWMLRFGRIERTIAHICALKRNRAGSPSEIHPMRVLVSKFRRIRPYVYTADAQCLKDALVLTKFLAMNGQHPSIVFAVQTRPFQAHCWVQAGRYVLNDTPYHVCSFTPIMTA